jgi:nucleoside-diphosphate-sugar epimerase
VPVGGVIALESIVAEMPEYVLLRYGALYGPGTAYAAGGLLAEALTRGYVPANDGVTSFLHVEDAALAALGGLSWPSGTYNIVDDDPAPAHQWVPLLAEILRAAAPERSEGRAPWERGATNTRARDLGWLPIYASWRFGFRTASHELTQG